MDLRPRGYDKIVHLLEKGVSIPNPLTVDVGDEIDPDLISADGVIIYPGCRLYGAKTVISAGTRLGAEAPVTLQDCRLGPRVELKGGYFKQSVFLAGANMGSGAQVREACLLEEEAGGAHCVGLKQTILFPFVTLGSLINFCDCLMAGGTSRKDHSEVGSSYIHFNFTPDGDKTTPSLFGDVPRGVMLDRPPIFLGGQGGTVGPVRMGYGTVVGAGCILREDVLDDGQLVVTNTPHQIKRPHSGYRYGNLTRVVRNNIVYLANLAALEVWYEQVRQPFFARQEFGQALYSGALEILALAREERAKRLVAMAGKVSAETEQNREFRDQAHAVCALFSGTAAATAGNDAHTAVPMPGGLRRAIDRSAAGYLETIQSLSPDLKAQGVEWLQTIVDTLCGQAAKALPSLDLS